MIARKTFGAALCSLAATLSAAVPARAAAPCLSSASAQSVASVIAPSIVKAVRLRCAPSLPASAYLKRSGDRLIAKLQAGAQDQLPAAIAAISKLAGSGSALQGFDLSLIPPQMVRELLDPLVAAKLDLTQLDPTACGRIDRALTLIDPLPARNIAGLLVILAQAGMDQANSGKNPTTPLFSICEATKE